MKDFKNRINISWKIKFVKIVFFVIFIFLLVINFIAFKYFFGIYYFLFFVLFDIVFVWLLVIFIIRLWKNYIIQETVSIVNDIKDEILENDFEKQKKLNLVQFVYY